MPTGAANFHVKLLRDIVVPFSAEGQEGGGGGGVILICRFYCLLMLALSHEDEMLLRLQEAREGQRVMAGASVKLPNGILIAAFATDHMQRPWCQGEARASARARARGGRRRL